MDTIVFGIDGGEWNVVDPLLKEGHLPNLSRLVQSGVRGELASTKPPVSPPAWNSIQTGMNPGKHGIYDFSSFGEQYQRRSVSSSDRQATPFWRVMNDNEVTTGLFKLPFTYPPDEVDGFFVTGFPTPDSVSDYANPMSVREIVGEPERLFESYEQRDKGDYAGFKQNLLDVADRQTDLLLDVLDERNPEFLMTVFDGSDRLQHFFWKYVDDSHPRFKSDSELSSAFREYYEVVDDGIGRVLDNVDGKPNVLIISDHGFEELSYDVYVDEWLEEAGFIEREDPGSALSTLNISVGEIIKQAWDVVKSVGLDSQVKSILPEDVFESGREMVVQSHSHRLTDWEHTSAFFSTLSGQSIFVNLEERFAEGTVSEAEYDDVVASLREGLLKLTHPETGKELVEAVYLTDEIYNGWALDQAPDLVIETSPVYTMKGGFSESLVQPSSQHGVDRSGDHRKEGMLIACGPDFKDGRVEGASVLDIAPTLLYLHNCPIPESVDGEVLTSLFTERVNSSRSIEKTDAYGRVEAGTEHWSPGEEKELEDRLSDMGYL